MHDNPWIAAIGALGAWLLVAGPLYQASIELHRHGITQRRNLPASIPKPQPISAWWWLVLPVAYWKHHVEKTRIRAEALKVLPSEDVERMLAFSNTALGWSAVAAGATLIAVKETWELVEIADWPSAITWLIVIVALLLAAANAALQTARTAKIRTTAAAARPERNPTQAGGGDR